MRFNQISQLILSKNLLLIKIKQGLLLYHRTNILLLLTFQMFREMYDTSRIKNYLFLSVRTNAISSIPYTPI